MPHGVADREARRLIAVGEKGAVRHLRESLENRTSMS
jgi:hypothetical protein